MRLSLEEHKNNLISEISKFFDKDFIEHLAQATGFVQRESKLQGLDFFLLCVFAHQKSPTMSLDGLCGELISNNVMISKQSLQDRFNERSVEFMHQLVGEVLSKKLTTQQAVIRTNFSRIIIGDSTVFQLPEAFEWKYRGSGGGASSSAIKIQYQFDLLTHEIVAIVNQEGTRPDCKFQPEDLQANDLRLEDLGYYKLDRLKQIDQAGAFFVSRFKFGINAFVEKPKYYEEIDFSKIIRTLKVNQIKSMQVYLGDKEMFPVRLIIEKVPKKIADEKRRKLKTDKQIKRKNLSQERLAFCDMNVYITNTDEQQLPAEKVKQCYGLRWQIEIIFKAWKSIFHLDHVKPMRIERFECLHYGRLILIILSTNLFQYFRQLFYVKSNQELSELKAFRAIVRVFIEKYNSLVRLKYSFGSAITNMLKIIEKTCIKDQKRNKLKPLTILNSMSLT